MMPEGRRKSAELLKKRGAYLVPLVHVGHLYLEDLPDLRRLETVYGKLDRLFEKGVLIVGKLLFQAERGRSCAIFARARR